MLTATRTATTNGAILAFDQYFRVGFGGLNRQDRAILEARYVTDPRMSSQLHALGIHAAQSVGLGSGGGFMVPDELMPAIVEAMKAFGGMRAVSTTLPTRSGADLPIPTDNDTGISGEIVTENSTHNDGDIAFGQVVLQSFLYSSKVVRISQQLLQDARLDMARYVSRKLGQRIGRIQNQHFTTGDGSSQPRGIVPASTLGTTAAGSSDVAYDELVDLLHSVDPAYQLTARFMFNSSTLGLLRKLKDSENNPMWGPMVSGTPDAILGRPYTINENMPAASSGQKSVLYGDFLNYHIRDVGSLIVLRLDERFVDRLQVGFVGFLRSDGDLVDAGTNPIKHLIQA
jgi:HK97 family phage major capsid protein